MSYRTHSERSAGRDRVPPTFGPPDDPAPVRAGGGAPWTAGQVVAGRFVLQQRLGRGRYGPIYKALDRSLSEALIGVEHHVALHELHPRITAQPVLLERLETLPLHPQAWSHPNLLKLLELGRDGEEYFLTGELLEGASCRLILDENPSEPLTYEEVLAVLRGVGDALNYAHAKGIVHGNIRPENVFVTERYNVKLLDLLPGNERRPAPFFPEDVSSDGEPHLSDDVYGLACIAYELLTRRHPYNGNTPLEALNAGLAPHVVPDLPLPRWQALSRGLALRRERRTAGVPELLAGLGVTGTELLRRGKASAPKTPEVVVADPTPAVRLAPAPEAWPEVTVPAMESHYRVAKGPAVAPPPARDGARRLEEPLFARRAYDDEIPAALTARSRATREWSPARIVVGAAVLAALVVVTYRDHERLVTRTADFIEASVAFATNQIARFGGRAATPAEPTADDAVRVAVAPEIAPRPVAPEPAIPEAATPEPASPETATPEPAARQPAPPQTAAPLASEGAPEVRPAEPPAPRAPPATAAPTPSAPRFGFAERTVTVGESEASARIVLSRSGALDEEASVVWWTTDGSALADEDYAVLGARIERFAPGETSKVVNVPLIGDSVAEGRESFIVNLRAERAGSGAGARLEVVVVDDDR